MTKQDKQPMSEEKMKYPATCVVHWATGPVNACDYHANALIKLGAFMGSHVVATKILAPAECANCVNEAGTDDEKYRLSYLAKESNGD